MCTWCRKKSISDYCIKHVIVSTTKNVDDCFPNFSFRSIAMSCSCNSPNRIDSWNDLLCNVPSDPRDILAMTRFAGTAGDWYLSSNYHRPQGASVWVVSPIVYGGEASISTNASDQQQMVFDATSWNQSHLSVNSDVTTAPPLRKTIFLRAGIEWSNMISLNLGSSPQFAELQLSLLDNAATRGDAQGTIPVFRWTAGPYSGLQPMSLVFRKPGRFSLGLMGINNNSTPDYSMFEMDVVVVS